MNNWSKPNIVFWIFCFFLVLNFNNNILCAQEKYNLTHEDSTALEDVIVERYYEATEEDCADTTGGILPKGSVTYRIFVDMKPGYALQMVYGSDKHELFFKTSTNFFNHINGPAMTGFNVDPRDINKNTVLLDSWITMGAANKLQTGIPKEDDKDGSSYIKRKTFSNHDGLTEGVFPIFNHFNIDINFFYDRKDASFFYVNNGGWAALVEGGKGVKGPKDDNKVLIAQLTTNGSLSLQLNVQMRTPSGQMIRFAANNPINEELLCKKLIYNQIQ